MTDSTDDKLTPQHAKLSPQNEDFDFDLADVRLISEHRDHNSLPHFDEPVPFSTEELLVNNAVDIGVEQQTNHAEGLRFNAGEPLMPVQSVPEIKTNFYMDYYDKREKIRTEPTFNPDPLVEQVDIPSPAPIEPPAEEIPTPMANEEFYFEESYDSPHNEAFYFEKDEEPINEDTNAPVIDGSGMAVAIISQFKSKQESINKQQEKLIQDFSKKVASTTRLTYTAAFFGIAALVAATAFGVMLLKNNADISDLAGTTTALKDDIRNIKTLPNNDLEGTDPSLDQLNKKVDDVAGRLNQVTALQNKVASLEKALQVKQQAAVVAATATAAANPIPNTATIPAEPASKPMPTKAAKNPKNASAEQVATTGAVTSTKPEINKTANKKASEATLPANDINNLVAAPAANASTPAPAPAPANNKTTPASGAGWSVNLASSNQLADAKKTAESYAQKGVPVTITPITVKNETRYRIQVKGFKNKEEAAAYAAKAKDTLKLNSVWINP